MHIHTSIYTRMHKKRADHSDSTIGLGGALGTSAICTAAVQ